MTQLILIRGAPGSGKSTYADLYHPNKALFEADDYFLGKDLEYRYDRKKVKEAHRWCQSMTYITLVAGNDAIVANTFTKLWELEPYIKMARELGAGVTIYHCTDQYPNVHGVPTNTVSRMRKHYEPHPLDQKV